MRADRIRGRAALVVGIVVALMLVGVPALADDGRLVLDQSGSNGALTARLVDSAPGSARIEIHNTNEFWTTIDLQVTGVTLAPGPPLEGGIYAALGMIAPDGTASWTATWNPRQAAQVFVRTTPYVNQTAAGPLAAGLTFLSIVTDVATSAFPESVATGVVARAEALRQAVDLIAPLITDIHATVSIDGLTSGAMGSALWDLLNKPEQVEVLRQALDLFGVTTTTAVLEKLREWIPVVKLSYRTLRLAAALLNDSSSGGALFASEGMGVVPTTTTPPPATSTADLPRTSTPTSSLPATGVQPTPPASTTSPASQQSVRTGTIAVPGDRPWTDTGLDVLAGDHLYIVGSGSITIAGSDPGKYTNGDTVGASPGGYCTAAHGFTAPGPDGLGLVTSAMRRSRWSIRVRPGEVSA